MRPGLALDTGALIALERRDARMAKVFATARRNHLAMTVPTVALAQWWRGQRGPLWRQLNDAVDIEPLDAELARVPARSWSPRRLGAPTPSSRAT